MYKFKEDLRKHIGEIYDGATWEPVTGLYNDGVEAFQLWKFEKDVEFQGELWRCLLIRKDEIDPEDSECIFQSEDIFEKFQQIK